MDPNKLVTIDPETELRFFPQADGQSYKSYLSIANVSSGNVAYKVKTTAPRFYVVKPNQGILDRGQKITIDITLILSSENKIEDNKFLIQVGPCELSSSETYQLQAFWDRLDKTKSQSFKLKVALASAAQPPTFGGLQTSQKVGVQSETSTPSFKEESKAQPQAQVEQSRASMLSNTGSVGQPQARDSTIGQKPRHEYEKAPDDEINQSQASVTQSQNINQDNIKRKTEEVKRQLDQVLAEKQKIQDEINQLKTNQLENEKENYDWQQPDNKSEFRFQLIHLLITAIICIFIGGFLGSKDGPKDPAEIIGQSTL